MKRGGLADRNHERWNKRQPIKSFGEKTVKDIKRTTRQQYSAEDKIPVILDGPRGEDRIAEAVPRVRSYSFVSSISLIPVSTMRDAVIPKCS